MSYAVLNSHCMALIATKSSLFLYGTQITVIKRSIHGVAMPTQIMSLCPVEPLSTSNTPKKNGLSSSSYSDCYQKIMEPSCVLAVWRWLSLVLVGTLAILLQQHQSLAHWLIQGLQLMDPLPLLSVPTPTQISAFGLVHIVSVKYNNGPETSKLAKAQGGKFKQLKFYWIKLGASLLSLFRESEKTSVCFCISKPSIITERVWSQYFPFVS